MGEGQGQATEPMAGQASGVASTGGRSQGGPQTNNQKSPDSPLELKNAAEGASEGQAGKQDTDVAAQKFEREPWFAKLPPGMRKAIQAKAQGEAPRGYEERLRRYFESTN
jgi:hypothetical protein